MFLYLVFFCLLKNQYQFFLLVLDVHLLLNYSVQYNFHMIQIHDGFGVDSPMLKVENQIGHEVSRKNKPTVLYTKSSEAIVQFTKTSHSNMKLKIQKVL